VEHRGGAHDRGGGTAVGAEPLRQLSRASWSS
jgi:hypothetical protein